jgi:hypothetical protein
MKKVINCLLLLIAGLVASAHIGSPGVQMQGQAGAYRILVNVLPPDVIPGTASITVFVENDAATKVTGRPIYFRSGSQGAPSADELTPVPGKNSEFQGNVWFMEGGSSSIQLEIEGNKGKGEFIVPVIAVSTAKGVMPQGLGIGLGILGIILFLLMITTIGASVSDATLLPGEKLTAGQKKKRWVQMGISSLVCALMLYGGSSWWDGWAADYMQHLYKPLKGKALVDWEGDDRTFSLKIDTTDWKSQRKGSMLSTLIPDHGKLMHVFLVRTPGLDAFAHIHPERKDSVTFEAYLPKLPAGKYLMYADIVNYSGFTETIVDTMEIPEPRLKATELKQTAEEDTYVLTDPLNAPGKMPLDDNVVICGKPGTKTIFKDGSYAIWEGKPDKPLFTGTAYALNFEIFNPDGTPCTPEPYLGMLGHVAVVRSDGSVYIHLHPTGTFAMAAGQIFKNRLGDTTKIMKRPSPTVFRDSIDRYMATLKAMSVLEREEHLMTEMGMYDTNEAGGMGMEHGNSISFPYSFPKEGRYRIFLQIKRNEKILTGVFDVRVKDEPLL